MDCWQAGPINPDLSLPQGVRRIVADLEVKISRPFFRHQAKKIWLRAVNWLGDAVLTLPLLEHLRRLFPWARITVAALPRVASLYAGQSAVDQVLVLPPHPPETPARRWLQAVASWRRERFDLAVICPNSLGSALEASLAGIPHRLGYARPDRSWLLTHRVYRSPALAAIHQVYHYQALLRPLGPVWLDGYPQICLRPEERRAARQLLQANGWQPQQALIGLAPGAAYGPAKQWPPERFAAVADNLQRQYQTFAVLLGGSADRETARRVAQAMQTPILDLAGRTDLRQALSLLSLLAVLVTNDSGLMHAAAALGIPVVAIFGSTDPNRTGPFTPLATVLRHPFACSPCFRRTCPQDYVCLTAVTVPEVTAAAVSWLEKRA